MMGAPEPKEHELFKSLDPPQGGLARLRERIRHESRRQEQRRSFVMFAGAAAAAMLVILLGVIFFHLQAPEPLGSGWQAVSEPTSLPPQLYEGKEQDVGLIYLDMVQGPREPVVVVGTSIGVQALHRMPVKQEGVIFYTFVTR